MKWILNQQNKVLFVMIDSTGVEVAGLGSGFTLEISKNGGAFIASGGVKAEISDGWYSYLSTVSEADTLGPVAIKVTGAGAIQQNLEYEIKGRNAGAIEFTYTLTDSVTTLPIEGAAIWITADIAGSNVIWRGVTGTAGIAIDYEDNKPFLQTGTYHFWRQKTGYSFTNPDTETVS